LVLPTSSPQPSVEIMQNYEIWVSYTLLFIWVSIFDIILYETLNYLVDLCMLSHKTLN
jgi:hypothetical protein